MAVGEALREAIGWTYGEGECTPERRAELEAVLARFGGAGRPDDHKENDERPA